MDYLGGCQCGATRYTATGKRDRASICYCRMCQKASGGPFMAFVRFGAEQLSWSKPPAVFASSNLAERGFCPACGTSLTYRKVASDYVSVTLQSLDQPALVAPEMVFSPETQVPWCLTVGDLPAAPEDVDDGSFESYQHPDVMR